MVTERKLYAGEVAARVGLPVLDLVKSVERRSSRPVIIAPTSQTVGVSENAEFVAISLLTQAWDDIAPWLIEDLFFSEVARRAFVTLAEAGVTNGPLLQNALESADPEVRELLERAAVADVEVAPTSIAFNLIGTAVRRILGQRTSIADPEEIHQDREARRQLESLDDERAALAAAESLLRWLSHRGRESGGLSVGRG